MSDLYLNRVGLLGVAKAYEHLKDQDNLEKIDKIIDWSGLDTIMQSIVFKENPGKGGRPPLCRRMMGKVMILQALNSLSDDKIEYFIDDRLSFKRFVNLAVGEKAPDAKSIWLWRERMVKQGIADALFAWFDSTLNDKGYAPQTGSILDATFVPTHKPTGKLKKQEERGEPLRPAQEAQRDKDATFTKKGGITYHGYKNHVLIDTKHKLIRSHETTTASTHDSQCMETLITPVRTKQEKTPEMQDNKEIWADSAYASAKIENMLVENGFLSCIHERAYRNKPLSNEQKSKNTIKSKIRARVEHVFGYMAMSMGGLQIHTLSLARAKFKMCIKNMTYNIMRFVCLENQKQRAFCAQNAQKS